MNDNYWTLTWLENRDSVIDIVRDIEISREAIFLL